jgi:hypothetical protein
MAKTADKGDRAQFTRAQYKAMHELSRARKAALAELRVRRFIERQELGGQPF